jgi:hypothetical protein
MATATINLAPDPRPERLADRAEETGNDQQD